jgi:hypothetical protein
MGARHLIQGGVEGSFQTQNPVKSPIRFCKTMGANSECEIKFNIKMKTTIFKSLLLLLPLLVLLSGCSETEDVKKTDFLANAGAIHNQLLDHYYQNRLNTTPGTGELISEVVNLSSEYLLGNGYDQRSVSEAASLLRKEYSSSHLKSVMDHDYSIDAGMLAEQFADMELYSDSFIEDVGKIITMAAEEADIRSVKTYINTDFADAEYENEKDREGQALFVNIFNSSYIYWTGEDNSNLKHLELDDNTKVIINDGIGGILGLVFGPAGSIITATVFSAATNEELKNR